MSNLSSPGFAKIFFGSFLNLQTICYQLKAYSELLLWFLCICISKNTVLIWKVFFFVGAAAGRESLSRAPPPALALADIPVGSCGESTLEPGHCQILLQGTHGCKKRFSNDKLKVHLKVFQRCGFEGEDGGA